MSEQQPSTQQRLATAIGTVIIPMVETVDGIDDGPLQQLFSDHAHNILEELQMLFAVGTLTRKEP